MTGISPDLFLCTTLIQCTFVDDIGNSPKIITGSGFGVYEGGLFNVIDDSEKFYFVTNKHNLVPGMKSPKLANWKLQKVEILFRKKNTDPSVLNKFMLDSETKFFEVENFESILKYSQGADVALFYGDFNKSAQEAGYSIGFINLHEIADHDFFNNNVLPLDNISFVGFPGKNGDPWWDNKSNLPIGRHANIASHPHIPFKHESIKTEDVVLTSGLSFSGSSGSLVALHEKGESISIWRGHTKSKIIGIMSGHWDAKEKERDENLLFHSGLSYFTRSTSILELIDDVQKI